MNSFDELSTILPLLHSWKRILVVSHYNPDADAYGSSGAVTLALRQLGKEVLCINESGPMSRYFAIPGVSEVHAVIPTDQEWDGLIITDCGSLKRVGDSIVPFIEHFRASGKEIVNIDHHISNELFGTQNLVVSDSSSTCEVLCTVLKKLFQLYLPKETRFSTAIANCLLAGIIGDTGSFRYPSTTAETLRVAADLVDLGASPSQLFQSLYGEVPVQAVRFQATALSGMELVLNDRVAIVTVTRALVEQFGVSLDDSEVLVERTRDMEGVFVSVLIREAEGLYRVSLRSKLPAYNVSEIAQKFGGGGHVLAAGLRWRGELRELRERLLEELEAVMA